MLKTRIITAIVLLLVVLAALFVFPAWAWAAATMAATLACCWEWSRFAAFSARGAQIYLGVSALLGAGLLAVALAAPGRTALLVCEALFVAATLFWIIAVPVWLKAAWRARQPWVTGAAGWLVLFPTWAALLLLHAQGPWLVLTFMAMVWVADIGAYFAGKRFGQTRLAPAISPGKTWEGVVGGLIGVMAYFFVWLLVLKQIGDAVWARDLVRYGAWMPLLFLALAAVSVLGDLFESWMKRGAGLKDSSNLLPGHGGILDRIDALTAALPLAGLFLYVIPKVTF